MTLPTVDVTKRSGYFAMKSVAGRDGALTAKMLVHGNRKNRSTSLPRGDVLPIDNLLDYAMSVA